MKTSFAVLSAVLVLLATNSHADPLTTPPSKAEKPYANLIKGKWEHQEEPLADKRAPFLDVCG